MSDTLSGDTEKPLDHSNDDGSKTVEILPVTVNDSDKTSTPKNLSDMPLEVVGLIIERSEYKEQLILRKVSKPLRALVDNQKPACSSIRFICMPKHVFFYYGDDGVFYASPKWEKIESTKKNGWPVLVMKDYEKIAFDDLALTLKNPKLQLDDFDFDYSDDPENPQETYDQRKEHYKKSFENIETILKSLNHQLSVREFTIDSLSSHSVLAILPHLKPNDLKRIEMLAFRREFWDRDLESEVTEKLFSLDQWKQCENLKLNCATDIIYTEQIDHFKNVQIFEYGVSEGHLMRLRDQMAKIEIFESLTICYDGLCYMNLPEDICGPPAPPNDKTEIVSHYSIPDSDYYLEFMLIEESIEIVKKKKEVKKKSI